MIGEWGKEGFPDRRNSMRQAEKENAAFKCLHVIECSRGQIIKGLQ